MPGPKGGNKDVVDVLNGIFDVFDLERQLRKDKEEHGLTDEEVTALRDAYLRQNKSFLEKAGDDAAEWGMNQLGIPKPPQSTPEDILNKAKARNSGR